VIELLASDMPCSIKKGAIIMSEIDSFINAVLVREGGFVDHPSDRGGPTNFGITITTLSGYIGRRATREEVKALSEDVARDIYEKNYFIGPRINLLPENIQSFVFDSAVNHGPRRGIKFVQSVCNQAGYLPMLSEDGAMGPNTRKGAEWAGQQMGGVFLKALVEERRNFYSTIVESNPSQFVFWDGWMNRLKDFEREVA